MRPRDSASVTIARAMLCGKCSSMQAARRRSSSSEAEEHETTRLTLGVAQVSVPVLSKTTVSAAASASRYLPPRTVTPRREASSMALITAMGVESLMAHE